MTGLFLRAAMAAMMLWARLERRVLPVSWLYAMGRASARTMYLWLPSMRRALHANARRLLGPTAGHTARQRLALAVLESYTRFFVELLTAPKTYPDPAAFLARMVGRAHGEAARDRGQGVIAVTLHMGNFELGPMLLRQLSDRPVAIVYRKDPFGLIEAMRSEQREQHGLEEIDTGNALFGVRALDVLRRRGFLLAAADIGFEGGAQRGKRYPFLGGWARFLDWPARLAVASGAPIVPSFVVRDAAGEYRVEMCEAILPEAEGDAEAIMRRLVAAFEVYARRYPEQWLILHRYWEDEGAPIASASGGVG